MTQHGQTSFRSGHPCSLHEEIGGTLYICIARSRYSFLGGSKQTISCTMPSTSATLTALILLVTTSLAPAVPSHAGHQDPARPPFQINSFPASRAPVPATAQFESSTLAFSSAKIPSANDTSFEWYWFDAVSSDLSTAVVVIFFIATPLAFPLLGPVPSVVSVAVTAKIPNGSVYFSEVPASEASIASGGVLGQGAVGEWVAGSGDFASTMDNSAWKVNVDTTALDQTSGIKANIILKSRAPAHYPCSASLSPGEPLQILPHLGWANAVPDSQAEGTFTLVDGTRYVLGNGTIAYHDHNWGDIPFPDTIRSWYWGHAHVGEWSLVFFNGIAANGERFADAYVARAGRVVVVDCRPDSVDVKDVTAIQGGKLPILEVRYGLPDGTMLTVEVAAVSVNALVDGVYERFVTSVTGGVVGRRNSTGIGMFEHFLQQA